MEILIITVPLFLISAALLVFYAAHRLTRDTNSAEGLLGSNNITVAGTVAAFTPFRPSIWVKCNIQVRFRSADNHEWMVGTFKLLRHTEFSKFQPGAMLPVCYNPAYPQQGKIVLGADPALLQEAIHFSQIQLGLATQKSIHAVKNGIQAQGVVLSAQPSGKILQGHAEMCLHLKVTKPDGSTFEATLTKAIPQLYVSQLQVGTVLTVFWLPYEEQNIAIALSMRMLDRFFMFVFG